MDHTSASLLVRLRDSRDVGAWEVFVRVYSPLVFRLALRSGLQDADAADITQDVLQSVHGRIAKFEYDRTLGSFRGWLRQVARSRIADWSRRRKRHPAASGGTDAAIRLSEHAGPDDEQDWEQEYRKTVFNVAAEKIKGEFRGSTFPAFWETAVNGREPGDVARELGMTAGAVYIAKSRVTARLREVIAGWESDEL
jgi:RNA polymerase sigma-70 factor (ECF subfamily)